MQATQKLTNSICSDGNPRQNVSGTETGSLWEVYGSDMSRLIYNLVQICKKNIMYKIDDRNKLMLRSAFYNLNRVTDINCIALTRSE